MDAPDSRASGLARPTRRWRKFCRACSRAPMSCCTPATELPKVCGSRHERHRYRRREAARRAWRRHRPSERVHPLVPGLFADVDKGGVVVLVDAGGGIAEVDLDGFELAVLEGHVFDVAESGTILRLAIVEDEDIVAPSHDGGEGEL